MPLRLYGWIVLGRLVAFGVQTAITAIGGEVIGTCFAALAMFAVSVLIGRKARPPTCARVGTRRILLPHRGVAVLKV